MTTRPKDEVVDHPPHYTGHPTGIECIDVIEHFSANVANAMKYLWRCHDKGKPIEDLEKARWYISREIERILKHGAEACAPKWARRSDGQEESN